MNDMPGKIKALLYIGGAQLLLFNILYWNGNVSIDVLGQKVSLLGNKSLVVKPPQGMIYIEHPDSLARYENEGILFIIKGDSLNPEKPLVWAEVLRAGEMKTLEDVSKTIEESAKEEIVFNRIQGSSLNVIFRLGKSISDTSFTYSRYLSAFPYYLKLSSTYSGNHEPPQDVLKALKSVELRKK